MTHGFNAIGAASLGRVACLTLALLVGACAIDSTPRVKLAGPGLARGAEATLTEKTDPTEEERLLGQALRDALAAHSVTLTDRAAYLVDYSIAVRASSLGTAQVRGDQIEWDSRARKRFFLDRCRGDRARINIVAIEKATGALIHRATGELDSCNITPASLAELTTLMVGETISNREQFQTDRSPPGA